MNNYLVATNKSIYELTIIEDTSGTKRLTLYYHGNDNDKELFSKPLPDPFGFIGNDQLEDTIEKFVKKSTKESFYGLYEFNITLKKYDLIRRQKIKGGLV